MNLIIEKNENVDFMVDKIFKEPFYNLSDLDTILAGGFIVSCWNCSLMMGNPIVKSNFENYFDHKNKSRTQVLDSYYSMAKNFSDIDIWIKKDSKISDEYSFVLKNHDSLKEELISFPPNNTFKVQGKDKPSYAFQKGSKWANTFRGYSKRSVEIIQFMKKQYEGVPDLLKEFDFENCKFAYHNGLLYYSEDAINAFINKELVLSNDRVFVRNTLAGKVYSSLRAFKYAKRYGLSFDKTLSKYIFKIMFDSCNLTSEEYVKMEEERVTNNFYVKEYCSPDVFFSMVDQLMRNLELFSVMKNYNPIWTGYFVNNKNSEFALKSFPF